MLSYLIVFAASVLCGYGVFRLLLVYIPRRLIASEGVRCQEIIAESRRQVLGIKEKYRHRGEEELVHLRSEVEESVQGKQEDLKVVDDDLDAQEEYLQREESRVATLEGKIASSQVRIGGIRERYQGANDLLIRTCQELQQGLQERCGEHSGHLQERMVADIVESRSIECQKILKAIVFDHKSGAKRIAQRFLARVHSRYSPDFIWPRLLNSVEIKDNRERDFLLSDDRLLRDLGEMADGVQIKLITDRPSGTIKLNGGFGLSREAVRLTLNDLLGRSRSNWAKAEQVYLSHVIKLEQEALKLGRRACRELELEGIHAEVQKMIGSLNWRTSYKQNQWYHSVEVAVLAGLIAHELGVDPALARRCGLLHDIGKSIDYRIEGSHAVISGDYADRYGEERLICDVVMSHHNDLVVETPLAYVLKSADTLSGARPGARVNLEEDYHSRLSAIENVIMEFKGVAKVMIMNGAREIHVEVDQSKVAEKELPQLTQRIAEKLSEEVTFPGQIKIVLSRRFEATMVA